MQVWLVRVLPTRPGTLTSLGMAANCSAFMVVDISHRPCFISPAANALAGIMDVEQITATLIILFI